MNNNAYWKPIESAPKDGTRILIAYYDRKGDTEKKRVGFAKWDSQPGYDRPRPYWDIEGWRRVSICRDQVAVAWAEAPFYPEDTIAFENI